MAAEQGASLVLAAGNRGGLREVVTDIRRQGGRAIAVVADITDPKKAENIAASAIREFGRVDSWVNCAPPPEYGRVVEVSLKEQRRQFDTTYWGQVHACLTAVLHLRGDGGAIVNVGGCLSDRALPLRGAYYAALHAFEAFTDALRMELEEPGIPVSVSLVKPAAVDTPFPAVANAILYAAQTPSREVIASVDGAALDPSELPADMRPRAALATFVGLACAIGGTAYAMRSAAADKGR
jgi:NAD(P)-dependent dehydrogenase (short-subunit alcohol dehydrogenase family)